MILIADTHVHLYPSYDVGAFLRGAYRNLKDLRDLSGKATAEVVYAVALTERHDCNFFTSLKTGKLALPRGMSVTPSSEPEAVWIQNEIFEKLLIIAGRQIVTRERIEVLGLATEESFSDGSSLSDTISALRERRAIPVLPWSPGKWLSERGRVITKIIETSSPQTFLLGDISMRPRYAPIPKQFSMAAARGFKLIAGTDPLPQKSDEALVGTYGILYDGVFDAERPVTAFRSVLLDPQNKIQLIGDRSSPIQALKRYLRNKFS